MAALAHRSHTALLQLAPPDGIRSVGKNTGNTPGAAPAVVPEVLPSPGALRLLSLGYKNLAADYYWLRSVSDYGNKRMVHAHYPNLWPLLSRVHALDSLFAAPYIFAGNVMTLNGMPWRNALDLLKVGMQMRPDVWRIAFLYGFNLYYLEQDYIGAAHALATAAAHADAPAYTGPLAARLAAEAGAPDAGLVMVDALLADTDSPETIALLQDRRQRLQLEVDLRSLNAAAAAYVATHDHPPRALEDLVGLAGVQAVPADPFGGAYVLEADVVRTQHEALRLRLKKKGEGDTDVSH
jgi:hypothetical protein